MSFFDSLPKKVRMASESTSRYNDQQGGSNWVDQKGVRLIKGYIAENDSIPINRLVQTHNYSTPLSTEELEAIATQWKYLCCTVTGASFKDTILGLPLRVYPRKLPESERARQSEDSKRANEAAAARVDVTALGMEAGVAAATPSQDETYNVYPTITPPNQKLKPIRWSNNPNMGKVEIIVGPFISIEAYNNGATGEKTLGIKPAHERGVVDYDQQYNAINLQLFVPTIDGTKRQGVTNRLSFYINPQHGDKVFPNNIESQMSLMLYRTANKYEGYQGKQLIPKDFKAVFPRILKETIHELITNKNQVDQTRMDHALRTYFLVHQVAIHFVIDSRYNNVYRYLYQTVMEFSQAPVQRRGLFYDIEEFLITANLVNVQWQTIKYAFIHMLVRQFIDTTENMNPSTPIEQKVRHMFNQHQRLITSVLLIWSFQSGNTHRTLPQLAEKYDRCWGSLPKTDIDAKKTAINAVRECKTMADFWRMVGMARPDQTDHEVNKKIYEYFQKMEGLRYAEAPPTVTINIPDVNQDPDDTTTVQSQGVVGYQQKRDEMVAKRAQEDIRKHQGFPVCNDDGTLPSTQCAYPECGKKFNSRAEMFDHHLNTVMPDMRYGYHSIHRRYAEQVLHGKTLEEVNQKLDISPVEGRWYCPVNLGFEGSCGETFDERWKLYEHYVGFRFPGQWEGRMNAARPTPSAPPPVASTSSAPAPSMPTDEDGDTCVVCMDATRNATFVPCGHLATCYECSQSISNRKCPICRAKYRQVLRVYFV